MMKNNNRQAPIPPGGIVISPKPDNIRFGLAYGNASPCTAVLGQNLPPTMQHDGIPLLQSVAVGGITNLEKASLEMAMALIRGGLDIDSVAETAVGMVEDIFDRCSKSDSPYQHSAPPKQPEAPAPEESKLAMP